MKYLDKLPLVGKYFRSEAKESVGEFIPDDPRYQRFFAAYLGLFYQVDKQARARGGKIWDWPVNERMIFIARGLMEWNPYAQGFINNLRSYVLGCKGFRIEVIGKKVYDDAATAYINKFKKTCGPEGWYKWEREIFERVHGEGDMFLRFFPTQDCVTLRPIEPEWVIAPDGTDEWTFGCHNIPGDVHTIDMYYENVNGIGEYIDASEVIHIKSKLTPQAVKRGNSDFKSTCQLFDDSFRTWRNYLQSEAVRQGIVYFSEQAEGVNGDDVQAMIAATADYSAPAPAGRPGIPATKLQQGVGVEYLQPGTKLHATPSPEAMQGTMAGVNMSMLAAGRPYNFPVFLMTGDMNSNNTLDLSELSPFGSAIQDEQYWYSQKVRDIFMKVLEIGVAQGHLDPAVLDNVDIVVTPEHRPSNDIKAATDRLKILHEDGIISTRERTTGEGYDYEEQQEQRVKDGDPPVSRDVKKPNEAVEGVLRISRGNRNSI